MQRAAQEADKQQYDCFHNQANDNSTPVHSPWVGLIRCIAFGFFGFNLQSQVLDKAAGFCQACSGNRLALKADGAKAIAVQQ